MANRSRRSDIGPTTLLCERCGYVLEGLGDALACPECGRPVAESLPRARPGTPWQQEASARAWMRTFVLVHTRPRTFWSAVTPGSPTWSLVRAFNLVSVNCVLASLVPGVLLSCAALVRPGVQMDWAGFTVLGLLVIFPMLWGATWLEARGLRFFSARRGWRVDDAVAWTVCAHASFAWWPATTGMGLALVFNGVLQPWVSGAILNTVVGILPPGMFGLAVLITVGLAGFAAGMLAFETLAYLGARALRYANRSASVPSAGSV
jgi:hypothetical protein